MPAGKRDAAQPTGSLLGRDQADAAAVLVFVSPVEDGDEDSLFDSVFEDEELSLLVSLLEVDDDFDEPDGRLSVL